MKHSGGDKDRDRFRDPARSGLKMDVKGAISWIILPKVVSICSEEVRESIGRSCADRGDVRSTSNAAKGLSATSSIRASSSPAFWPSGLNIASRTRLVPYTSRWPVFHVGLGKSSGKDRTGSRSPSRSRALRAESINAASWQGKPSWLGESHPFSPGWGSCFS
ncbi:MAG: hypothetical protein ACLUEQ_08730 [Cloacibacillus evryensis]